MCREVSPRMLVTLTLCVAIIASSSEALDPLLDEDDAGEMFGARDQAQISELGRHTEENLNCFLQFDRSLADKWATEFDLRDDPDAEIPEVGSRLTENANTPPIPQVKVDTMILTNRLRSCIGNLTEKVKNPGTRKCMKNLISSEIERENFISAPELFDNSLPLPSLTFLDFRELAKLLFQNRTWAELSFEEMNIYKTASGYLSQENSQRDKVFVLDQACEWKNLDALEKFKHGKEDQLKEFKLQVVRSISLQVAHAVFSSGDLKPGTWITVYRRWAPVRLKNLKELESIVTNDLKTGTFTPEQLCKYATTLANYFAEEELEALLPEKVSTLQIFTTDLLGRSCLKEERLCANGDSGDCVKFRELRTSYVDDLKCMMTFGTLLSNHFLYLIAEKYAGIQPRTTYPEMVCKKMASEGNLAVRYCRCVGSFCSYYDVGEIKDDFYQFIDGTVTVNRV